jgi:putative addiction module component (TIGR02574 family)
VAATVQSLGIDRLPVAEQLALVQQIWDHIAATGPRPMLTDAQREELRRRVAEDDADPDGLVPWDEVKARALARVRQ